MSQPDNRTPDESGLGRDATEARLRALVEQRKTLRLRWFLYRNRRWLRADTHLWGTVGWALVSLRWRRRAARWLKDWPDRPDAEPWMLVNVVEALRARGNDAEAGAAAERGLAMPASPSHEAFRLWLGAEAACDGRIDAARTLVDGIELETLDAHNAFLLMLVDSLSRAATADPASRRQAFADMWGRLYQSRYSYADYMHEPGRKRLYRRCLARLAKIEGGVAAWIRAKFWTIFFS